MLIAIIISLLMTFIPYQYIKINQIGLILGSCNFQSFPAIQYFSLFLIGIYFAKNNIISNFKLLIISLIATMIFFGFILVSHDFPKGYHQQYTGYLAVGSLYIFIMNFLNC